MTKKQFNGIIQAVKDGKLFGWLYDHQHELARGEVEHIARELAYAISQPDNPNVETFSRYAMADTFIHNIADFYDTFGFDDDDE